MKSLNIILLILVSLVLLTSCKKEPIDSNVKYTHNLQKITILWSSSDTLGGINYNISYGHLQYYTNGPVNKRTFYDGHQTLSFIPDPTSYTENDSLCIFRNSVSDWPNFIRIPDPSSPDRYEDLTIIQEGDSLKYNSIDRSESITPYKVTTHITQYGKLKYTYHIK